MVKSNATGFDIDGSKGASNRQNIYLWSENSNNVNQQWLKVDVGGGAYKLMKRNATGFALNGGSGESNRQNVSLYNSSSNSGNLQWLIIPE